jgi:hypothetical protein
MNGVLNSFKVSGDNILFKEPGICRVCQIGCGGFAFIGNNYRNCIELIIRTENDKVADLFDCTQFKNESLTKSMLGKRIEFDPNEFPF